MKFRDILSMSFGNLRRRKIRTFLTVLGVTIGTISIVAMLSIGLAMRQSMMSSLNGQGGATAINVSMKDSSSVGSDQSSAGGGAGVKKRVTPLDDKALADIKEIPHVAELSPQLELYATVYCGDLASGVSIVGLAEKNLKAEKLGEGSYPPSSSSTQLNVMAGNQVWTNMPDYINSMTDTGQVDMESQDSIKDRYSPMSSKYQYYVDNGAMDGGEGDDSTEAAPAASSDAATDPQQAPVIADDTQKGTSLDINVTGIMDGGADDYSSSNCFNMITDIDSLKTYLSANFKPGQIPDQPMDENGRPYSSLVYTSLTVNADSADTVEDVASSIRDLGFQVDTNASYIKEAQKSMRMVELALGGIGMVAFLVAIIGIANTMMMAIYERTKEIGIMKVLGCDVHNIMALFLTESGFIGFIGGVVGVVVTEIMSFAANTIMKRLSGSGGVDMDSISVIPWWLVIAAIVFATFMGMAAGFFPSRRAMKLSPLSAIHTE